MGRSYWLIELHVKGAPASYYTAPHHWHSCADLATKFHDPIAAKLEASAIRHPDSPHELKIVDHLWE